MMSQGNRLEVGPGRSEPEMRSGQLVLLARRMAKRRRKAMAAKERT